MSKKNHFMSCWETEAAEGRRSNMGIGLSVCYSIIKAHGGAMAARNNSGGKGATFSFVLDKEKDDE